MTFRALSADEEHSDDRIRVVVGAGRASVFVGVWGEQCRVRGLPPVPACPWEGDCKNEGAGLGAGTSASWLPLSIPRAT